MNEEEEKPLWAPAPKNNINESPETLQPDLFRFKKYALVNHIVGNFHAADLKWSLFCAACNSYRFDSVLKPFPPFFLMQDDIKQIERLRELIELCPSMPNIVKQLKNDTLPSLLESLLYWVLIELNEPTFKHTLKEEHQDILSMVSSKISAATPDFIFSVTYGSRHQQKFALTASNRSTRFAFHGSRLDNFYSIVNYGLQVSLNKTAAFGPGIYLSNEIVISLPYSPRGFTWSSSMFGSHISIIALCEVVDHPTVRSELDSNENSIFKSNDSQTIPGKYLIVQNSDLVRIRYLLVYCSDTSESVAISQSSTLLGWIRRHKMFTFVMGYFILLLGIGSFNSSLLYRYLRRLFKMLQYPDNHT